MIDSPRPTLWRSAVLALGVVAAVLLVFVVGIALLYAIRASTPATAPAVSLAPTATAAAATATPVVTPPVRTNAPVATAPVYVSGHGYRVELPEPYRLSERLSVNFGSGKPTSQEVFTARTAADEAAVGGACAPGGTSCGTWNYAAVVHLYTDVGTDTPRTFYTRSGGAVGESISDVTVDGRPAIKVTNGVASPLEYVIKDGTRMFRIGYRVYASSADMTVPAGATPEKLTLILESFHFVP